MTDGSFVDGLDKLRTAVVLGSRGGLGSGHRKHELDTVAFSTAHPVHALASKSQHSSGASLGCLCEHELELPPMPSAMS